MNPEIAWENLGRTFLGRSLDLPLRYSLQPIKNSQRSPFYINHGFVAGTPELFEQLYEQVRRLAPAVSRFLGNWFYGQVTLALAIESLGLPWRAQPMRYNFPNDPKADQLHPAELNEIILMHYLRTDHFDRQKFLTTEDTFGTFCALELSGSNRILQEYVLRLTGGRYPFT